MAPSAPAIIPTTSIALPSTPPQAMSRIDALFHGYQQQLPQAATLSESNGATLVCERHGYATYTLLAATASKVPIENDSDLPAVASWCRDDDPCIRQIALDSLIARIGFDRNQLVVPNMHDPEHFLYHDILVSLRGYLDAKHVPYDPRIFDGLLLDVGADAFGPLMHGAWEQDVDKRAYNFLDFVEIDAEYIRVTTKETHGDPEWPDHTRTTKIKEVRVNERHQFVITGAWDVVTNAAGYRGERTTPAAFVYVLWPAKKGIVWLSGGPPSYWMKLRKKGT
jgi:hypothetical protein